MGDKIDIKKEYSELKNKFNSLPDFDSLNNDFEIEFLEREPFILRQIRRRMNEKIILFCRIVEGILYPMGNSPINAYESQAFNEEQRNGLYELHKKLMVFERTSLLLDVETNDNKDVEFIKDVFEAWKTLKNDVTLVAEQMQDAWKNSIHEKEDKGYYG